MLNQHTPTRYLALLVLLAAAATLALAALMIIEEARSHVLPLSELQARPHKVGAFPSQAQHSHAPLHPGQCNSVEHM